MSIRTCVARAVCIVLTAGVASAPDPATARESDTHPDLERRDALAAGIVSSPPAEAGTGFLLDRLSKEHVRVWRDIEKVVAASDSSGQPRSPTLRRLWDWARTSPHVLHIEMVFPFRQPAGIAGLFQVERIDPAALRHVAVIRLCPRNIRRAVVGRHSNSVKPFVRFEGLTDVERYAEVLAHELAHAEYSLESPERLAQLEAAQNAIRTFRSGSARARARVPEDLERTLSEPFAVLTACEAHAESVEALVLRELAGDRPSQTATMRVR